MLRFLRTLFGVPNDDMSYDQSEGYDDENDVTSDEACYGDHYDDDYDGYCDSCGDYDNDYDDDDDD